MKIGYTEISVAARTKKWEKQCKIDIEVMWESKKLLPFAARIEQIVFAELRDVRLREMKCCSTKHKEWFCIDEKDAERVLKKWVKWTLQRICYNENGQPTMQESELLKLCKPAEYLPCQGCVDSHQAYLSRTPSPPRQSRRAGLRTQT